MDTDKKWMVGLLDSWNVWAISRWYSYDLAQAPVSELLHTTGLTKLSAVSTMPPKIRY